MRNKGFSLIMAPGLEKTLLLDKTSSQKGGSRGKKINPFKQKSIKNG